MRTLKARAANVVESAYVRTSDLSNLILDSPADAALPEAAQAYGAVKTAAVVDAWNRYEVPERRFEVRLNPLMELDRIKTVARRAGQLAVLAAGMGASAFFSRHVNLGCRPAAILNLGCRAVPEDVWGGSKGLAAPVMAGGVVAGEPVSACCKPTRDEVAAASDGTGRAGSDRDPPTAAGNGTRASQPSLRRRAAPTPVGEP